MVSSASQSPGRSSIATLRAAAPAVLPSLLLCDFGRLEAEIRAVEEAGAPGLHLDVMDGHFVPNLTYGLLIVETVRRISRLPIAAHLMISNPEKYVEAYVDAGADIVTIHREATAEPIPLLERIRKRGAAAGLAINPPTPVEAILPCLPHCDLVLVMSVMPGFGGQSFDESVLAKLPRIREAAGDDLALEMDGGINAETIHACSQAGAELFVVGSAIFGTQDYRESVVTLTRLAESRPR